VTPRVVGVIVARDEEAHLGPCLDSLAWTDARLVLLDSRTTDSSADVASARGADVLVRPFHSFPLQRNAALDLIQALRLGEWVIFVDADERATGSLASEVRRLIADTGADAPVGYWIPRRNFIWGGWIRHGGWSPDYQMRLLRVDWARYDEKRDVHELVDLSGRSGRLRETLIHYNYDTPGQFLRKQRHYARLDAQRLARQGVVPHVWTFVLQPMREFRRRFVVLRGYRDGWRGLALAVLLGLSAGETSVLLAVRRNSGNIRS
jgi:glycosyltransferase involved in cell wall biosynthesis